MKRILITGGTGTLGQALIPRLLDKNFIVRVMSRRAPRPGEDARVEWAQASLESGDGLEGALTGIDVVIHAASSPIKRQVDVGGTRRLLDHARALGIEHFLYISIVGIDQIGYAYYQNKLAAEKIIEVSGVPWSILRAVQFHDFIERLIRVFTRLPVAFVPTNWRFQVISTEEVADHLVTAVQSGPAGHLPDIGGPEVLQLGDMVRLWLSSQGMRKPIVHIPIPGKLAAGFRKGLNTTPNSTGKITWAEWLQERYSGSVMESNDKHVERGVSA